MSKRSTPGSGLSATARRIGIVLLAVAVSISMVGVGPAAASEHCTTETTSTVPVDVVFVIDTSGSMYGSYMTNTKDATKTAIGALPDNAQVSVVDFDSSASLVQQLTTDHDAANSTVDSLSAGGGTNMAAGIDEGMTELTGPRARPDAKKVMVVLGDGDVNSQSLTLSDDGKSNHDIRFITISVGSGSDVERLKYIAGETPNTADDEGDYYPSPSDAQLESVFQNIVSSITEVECESEATGDKMGPRFEVTNSTWSDVNPSVGETVTVTYTVENVGDREGWFYGIIHSDMDKVDRKAAKIDAGESQTFTVEVSWDKHGDHRLFVRTHYLGEVTVSKN